MFIILILILSQFPILADEPFQISYIQGEKFKYTEVSNLRKTVNGNYKGFVYRQVRGILETAPQSNGGFKVNGNFYILEESKRDTRFIANRIDKIVPVTFTIKPNGNYIISDTVYYPNTRDFPVFPQKAIKPGETWRAYGFRYVEPERDGVFTKVKFFCEYKYVGEKEYSGRKYHYITAQYALRYKQGDDTCGDPRLKAITNGGHKVEIYFDKVSKKPVFMRDLIIENLGGEIYHYTDGKKVTIKGFTQVWFDQIEMMDKEKIVEDIVEKLSEEEIKDIAVEESEKGVLLTLNNIHFVADKAIILPEERGRLDTLAESLKKIENRTFLVVGHTAKHGTEKEQHELSIQRAKAIVDYMVSREIDAKRFLYEGKGAKEPIAPNDTEENMKKNRRVEIIILED